MQLDFFLNDSDDCKIKGVDYVDLSEIDNNLRHKTKTHTYDVFPKGKYIFYKTGGINKFHRELGSVFPYIKNTYTGNVVEVAIHRTYLRCSLLDKDKRKREYKIHRLVGEAFIYNPDPEKFTVVDHKKEGLGRTDYRVDKLKWATDVINNTGIRHPKDGLVYEQRQVLRQILSGTLIDRQERVLELTDKQKQKLEKFLLED
tara:strand:- start:68 stop:670 length:603 start_codon:yes stop_codon:yes gene_type:complete